MDTNGHTPLCEDYVSFETAKLLKENGFDEGCKAFWKVWNAHITLFYCTSAQAFDSCCNSILKKYNDEDELNIAAPTLQMAMKWLREVHNIFIQVELYSKYDNYCFELFQNTHRLMVDHREVYSTYEGTCEAAIKYCLENLI